MAPTRSWPKKFTLRFSNELHRKFKVACSMQETTMNDFMIALLERELESSGANARKAKKPATRTAEANAP